MPRKPVTPEDPTGGCIRLLSFFGMLEEFETILAFLRLMGDNASLSTPPSVREELIDLYNMLNLCGRLKDVIFDERDVAARHALKVLELWNRMISTNGKPFAIIQQIELEADYIRYLDKYGKELYSYIVEAKNTAPQE